MGATDRTVRSASRPVNASKFFLVVAPGFEEEAKEELLSTSAKVTDVQTVKGGVSFSSSLEEGLSLNRYLRCPTRILLRLHHGKCKKMDHLKELLSELNLSRFFSSAPKVAFSSTTSKLFHRRKVPEQIERYLKKQLQVSATDTPPVLYLRFDHDWLTVSIDTSGTALYKRTPDKKTVGAPLRETLASGLFWTMKNHLPNDYVLIDPMCGSGTFLTEALRKKDKILYRDFAFEQFTVCRETELTLTDTLPSPKLALGFDSSKKATNAAQFNLKQLGISPKTYQVENRDLFDNSAFIPKPPDLPRVLITNPPHGKRLRNSGQLTTEDYVALLSQMSQKFNPQLIGVLLPALVKAKKIEKALSSFTIVKDKTFSQNTNPVVFLILKQTDKEKTLPV